MRIRATSSARRVDVFDGCGRLLLNAERPVEAELLAALTSLFTSGGRLTVKLPGKRPFVWLQPEDKEK